jgi:hypothetical protein
MARKKQLVICKIQDMLLTVGIQSARRTESVARKRRGNRTMRAREVDGADGEWQRLEYGGEVASLTCGQRDRSRDGRGSDGCTTVASGAAAEG